ncbi:MAG: hypothetical protein K2K05_04415, partial [Muribaculaceae bacterium]|nr:hypothetical protein [Muribaculaceae bacterium]
FISFNGWSINNTAFELIDKYSPECIKIQYCWDSFNSKDLRMSEKYFDKLYTFDIVDAKNPGWKLLPSFYESKDIMIKEGNEDYDLFMIGANHDGRYSFVRKVLRNLKFHDLNNYVKIFAHPINNLVMNFSIDCIKTILNFNHIHELLFKYGFENKEITINQKIGYEEYMRIMQKSKCILDDNCDGQAGLSPRFIRAMILNKKVITTNKWACDYSFVNEKNVLIVDKDKPVIDIDFIKSDICPPKPSNLDSLELSNWVKILIGEIECPTFEIN